MCPRHDRDRWVDPPEQSDARCCSGVSSSNVLAIFWVWWAGERKEPVEELGGQVAVRLRGTNMCRLNTCRPHPPTLIALIPRLGLDQPNCLHIEIRLVTILNIRAQETAISMHGKGGRSLCRNKIFQKWRYLGARRLSSPVRDCHLQWATQSQFSVQWPWGCCWTHLDRVTFPFIVPFLAATLGGLPDI